jgi:8-oxo-dGTP pyrophosphatase MutT (NUDIX family)
VTGGEAASVPGADPAATRSALSDEWVPGADGLPYRRAARVLLVDDQDRLLLLRGHDVDQPERSWWFTVGGGIDPGESQEAAALRELREETGIVLDAEELVGPVLTRSAVFDFLACTCRQDEVFYLARVASDLPLVRDGWTDVEADLLDELRWWPLDELERVELEVFPQDVAALVRSLLAD